MSDARLKSGGTILALFQHDLGKFSTEYLYSTDSALLGIRGLYNFGPDPRKIASEPPSEGALDGLYGRFSAGAELYYGALNKSGGASTGIRFTTLPRHTGFPYTMTLTLNPLMGNLSSTYSVKAGPSLALCSRFDFNVYSYESDLQLGCELWRRNRRNEELDWVYTKLGTRKPEGEAVAGVLKGRIDQNWNIGVLWEGRIKELLFSMGTTFDIKRRDQPFRTVGLELQYSS